ncbi:MAG: hypothetical protein OEW37_00975, partial [Rhodospirillaceae bacterium]|nr:hypothetical protein [Rhodospirillaceae bacterium]
MSTKVNLEDIDVVIVDADRTSRQTIRNILTDHGIRRISVAVNMRDMINILDVSAPDLLIS